MLVANALDLIGRHDEQGMAKSARRNPANQKTFITAHHV